MTTTMKKLNGHKSHELLGRRAERRRPMELKRKYFDPKFDATAVRILPGEHYVATDPKEMLVTVLGSCVAACIRDPLTGIGGMNHFMLPESATGNWGKDSAALRYGNHAMEVLINDLLKLGANKNELEIKVFGGASVSSGTSTVGDQNCAFIRKFLIVESLACSVFDLGGVAPRRIHYFPETGKVKRLLLRRSGDWSIEQEEKKYRGEISAKAPQGDVELFDTESC